MTDMPTRDTTGKCVGDCNDQVSKMEKDNQDRINAEGMEGSTAQTPSVGHAKTRDRAPGDLGGHV
jgi:hypothetical protein